MTSALNTARYDRSCGQRWGSELRSEHVLGAPCRMFAVRPRGGIAALLEDGRIFGGRPYLVVGDRRLGFSAHERAVGAVAAHLSGAGVKAGDRVLLVGANSIEWVVAFWAIHHLGAIVVLGNAWWSDEELAHAIRVTTPVLVLADHRRMERLPDDPAAIRLESLAALVEDAPARATPRRTVDEDQPAVILFTSGTTGLPKGATLTHRGVVSTLQSLLVRTNRLPIGGAEAPAPSAALLTLPLFHIGGLQQVITPMVSGGTMVFMGGRFDGGQAVDLIEREQVRVWSTVPSMAGRVIRFLQETGRGPLRGVRTVGLGGSPVGEQLRRDVAAWFPDARRGLAVTWGLSEAGGVVTTGAGEPIRARPGTVGRPLDTAEVRIDDPDETGQGEILVRSPSVMVGYWTEAGLDASPVDAQRWLRTGDVGRLDEDGYLYITDRIKDIVIRGGENIATPRVEDVLSEHPDVDEVAVIGLPHPDLGEELGAIVHLCAGSRVTGEDLAAFARERLAYFEVPSQWRFVDRALPQNSTGKILKRQLQAEWRADLSRDGLRRVP